MLFPPVTCQNVFRVKLNQSWITLFRNSSSRYSVWLSDRAYCILEGGNQGARQRGSGKLPITAAVVEISLMLMRLESRGDDNKEMKRSVDGRTEEQIKG